MAVVERFKQESMYRSFVRQGKKKLAVAEEVGVSGGSTVSNNFHLGALKIIIFWQFLLVT